MVFSSSISVQSSCNSRFSTCSSDKPSLFSDLKYKRCGNLKKKKQLFSFAHSPPPIYLLNEKKSDESVLTSDSLFRRSNDLPTFWKLNVKTSLTLSLASIKISKLCRRLEFLAFDLVIQLVKCSSSFRPVVGALSSKLNIVHVTFEWPPPLTDDKLEFSVVVAVLSSMWECCE